MRTVVYGCSTRVKAGLAEPREVQAEAHGTSWSTGTMSESTSPNHSRHSLRPSQVSSTELAGTVRRYNDLVESGVDSDCGKAAGSLTPSAPHRSTQSRFARPRSPIPASAWSSMTTLGVVGVDVPLIDGPVRRRRVHGRHRPVPPTPDRAAFLPARPGWGELRVRPQHGSWVPRAD